VQVKETTCPIIPGLGLELADALNECLMLVLFRKETDVAAKAFTTKMRERITRTQAVYQRMCLI
jgi:hypothetical protein